MESFTVNSTYNKNKKKYLWGFYLYLGVIFILSVIPVSLGLPTGSDKIKHAGAFFVYSLLMDRAFNSPESGLIVLSGFLFGAFIEFVQLFIPWRHGEYWDLMANLAGLLLGVLILQLQRNRKIDESPE